MSKRQKAGDLNESMIIQAFKDTDILDDPAAVVAAVPEIEATVVPTVGEAPAREEPDGTEESPATDAPKSKPRKRRGSYDEVFLKKKELKTRQPVYISQSIHQRISRLVHVLALADKEISVGGYIDNVLEEHLEQHRDEIDEMRRNAINP
jgi:hypothetical protein